MGSQRGGHDWVTELNWTNWEEPEIKLQHPLDHRKSKAIPEKHLSDWVSKVVQSCPPLSNSINCSLPGSSIHGIFQARILEWVVISFSRGSSPPRDQTRISCVSCIANWFFTHWAIGEAQKNIYFCFIDHTKAFDCVNHSKLWEILQEMGIPDTLPVKPMCRSRSNS